MTRIVVAGEALIDRVIAPDGSVVERTGGGPFNAARTMARLGADVRYLGRLSTDAAGRRLRDALAADGVGLDHVVATDDRTTTAVARIDERGIATYRFDLDGTSAAGLVPADLVATGLRPDVIEVLHVGTLGLALEPVGATVEALVASVPVGCLVFLDPNARPTAVRDFAAYRQRIARLAARADVIKVSVDDLRALDPDGDADAAAVRLRDAGGAVLLVTDGAADVEIVLGQVRRRLPVPAVDVVDTIGAGDAFGGAFLAEWVLAGHDRSDLADPDFVLAATGVAIEVAALTCQHAGDDPPTRAELERSRRRS